MVTKRRSRLGAAARRRARVVKLLLVREAPLKGAKVGHDFFDVTSDEPRRILSSRGADQVVPLAQREGQARAGTAVVV